MRQPSNVITTSSSPLVSHSHLEPHSCKLRWHWTTILFINSKYFVGFQCCGINGVPLDEIMSSSCLSFAILFIYLFIYYKSSCNITQVWTLSILIILVTLIILIILIIILIILIIGILVKISVKPEWIMSRPSREERYPRFREIGDSRTHFGKWWSCWRW